MQLFYTLLILLVMVGILGLFVLKAGRQMQYLRLQNKKPAGEPSDFWKKGWRDEKQRKERMSAFLLFPLLFPVSLDESREELNDLKRDIKRIHILIYFLLIVLVTLGIFGEKVF